VYLATVGKHGLRQVAESCYHKAHYAAQIIGELPGFEVDLARPFFKEFTVRCPRPPDEVNRRLLERKIIGGLDVSEQVPNGMLLCVTEMNTRGEIERLRDALAEVTG
jgi:glycine dehydrogenase subunit 1